MTYDYALRDASLMLLLEYSRTAEPRKIHNRVTDLDVLKRKQGVGKENLTSGERYF